MSSGKNQKKRYWAIIGYPESLPSNWIELLTETHLPIAISPKHDKDVNEGTGEVKKEHYHIILAYEGPTTFNNVKSLSDKLNSPIPKPIESIKGAYRYLTHQDNPEKAQYSQDEIKCLNGFNIADYEELTKNEIDTIKRNLIKIVKENDIDEYCDLCDFLEAQEMNTELSVALSHTIALNTYITSRRNKKRGYVVEQMDEMYKVEVYMNAMMYQKFKERGLNINKLNLMCQWYLVGLLEQDRTSNKSNKRNKVKYI